MKKSTKALTVTLSLAAGAALAGLTGCTPSEPQTVYGPPPVPSNTQENTAPDATSNTATNTAANTDPRQMQTFYGPPPFALEIESDQQEQSADASDPSQAKWTCRCGAQVVGQTCPNCGAQLSDQAWVCSCGQANEGTYCSNCGTPRPSN